MTMNEAAVAGFSALITDPSIRLGVLGRIGQLEARLARDEDEIAAAQEIRYRVFFGSNPGADPAGRDIDRFDDICDHLLVFDQSLPGTERERIVGTYRLLRQETARAHGGFYTSGEFELDRLVARHPDRNFLELGRSCVLPAWRTKRTIEVLWQGIWAYCHMHGIDVMTGCASFPGTSPAEHAKALSFLFHHCRAKGEWATAPLPDRRSRMNFLSAGSVDARAALAAMPPLVKGYMRLGAMFGDGCVIDREFGSVDVLVILPVEAISSRALAHFGIDVDRCAA